MIDKDRIEQVLKDTESLKGSRIKVSISKMTLTLTGSAQTQEQKEEAEQIAWKGLGIWTVSNQIEIDNRPH